MSIVQNFEVDFVVNLNLPECTKKHKKDSYTICCPFCGGRYKLNVHMVKNVWRCAKCGESGNAVSLHRKLNNISTYEEAYKDLLIKFDALSIEDQTMMLERVNNASNYAEKESPIACLSVRNWAYNELLNKLFLAKEHQQNLLKRGLSEEQIKLNGYKSYPFTNHDKVAEMIFGKNGEQVDFTGKNEGKIGIPGFYDLETSPKLAKFKGGILIPVITSTGKISCFQIRNNDLRSDATNEEKEYYHRYSYLSSSNMDSGYSVTGCENIHHTGFKSYPICNLNAPKTVWLTEGALKADVASCLIHQPFIGIMGVNNTSQLTEELSFLKRCGVENIFLCLDMDYKEKKEVKAALLNIINIIKQSGLHGYQCSWNDSYKGIDDLLLAAKTDNSLKLYCQIFS